MKDDRGSAVAALPILVLLVAGGVAALAGIALQPSSTVAAPVIPNPTLGPDCTDVAGPAPTDAAASAAWFQAVAACVSNRVEGTTYGADGTPGAQVPVSGLDGYNGVAVVQRFDGSPVVVVRWLGTMPPIVAARLGRLPAGAVVVSSTVRGASPSASSTDAP